MGVEVMDCIRLDDRVILAINLIRYCLEVQITK